MHVNLRRRLESLECQHALPLVVEIWLGGQDGLFREMGTHETATADDLEARPKPLQEHRIVVAFVGPGVPQ